jgi:hypothetical protein
MRKVVGLFSHAPALAVRTAPGRIAPDTVGRDVLTGGEGTTASPQAMPSWVQDPMNALL